jgi:aryl-alcohol dehydrogenase-like predicted oxidoreductase
VSEQSLYNLTERRIELEVIPACLEYGLAVIPWSPLAGGILAGNLSRTDGRRGDDWVKRALDAHGDRIQRFETLCEEIGRSPAQVALAWLLHRPGVTAPILGPRTMEHLDTAIATLDLELDEDRLEAIDGIWPGPGAPAPEAYAW